jgi:hypothetical protein
VRIDEAPVAFVGYGVSAPALGYDDYAAGIDVTGKVVAFLSGARPSCRATSARTSRRAR